MIVIKFPDGTKKSYKKGITGEEIARDKKADDAFVIKVDGELLDLNVSINKNASVKLITFKDDEGKEVFRHSTAHVFAKAVIDLFPKALPTIGPAVEEGFYYDFDTKPFHPDDLKKIERRMHEIVKENIPFKRIELTKKEALEKFKNNRYKTELIKEAEGKISAYLLGDFLDFCRGPHVPSSSVIKAFKLTKIAGAYWKGDVKQKQLQRIYGVSFPSKEELKEYLKLQEEAKRRDHRKIGKNLDLFSIHEEAPGFPFFHPKFMIIKNALIDYWKAEHRKAGYLEVQTPVILNKELWIRSGHWDHYKENMYFTKIDEKDFAIKPMNCPGGILIYKEKLHSYREFPLKIAELGLVHRHELSGVLAGLFRVRAFTQDDAHIYMTPEQIKDEVIRVIELTDKIYKLFGFRYNVELSTRPAKSIGTDKQWNDATQGLEEALKAKKIEYKINEGEGAFYGPKIDFHINDCIGRTWQCGTIQLDMAMPERFDLTYEGKDGKKHRPVMIHRTIYGSIERFIGILIEHYAGKFPLWLSPEQVRILNVADRHQKYAEEIKNKLFKVGIRVEVDFRNESIPKKVRDAQLSQVNYILVVGDKEIKENTATVRTRDNVVKGPVDVDKFLEQLLKEIKGKR